MFMTNATIQHFMCSPDTDHIKQTTEETHHPVNLSWPLSCCWTPWSGALLGDSEFHVSDLKEYFFRKINKALLNLSMFIMEFGGWYHEEKGYCSWGISGTLRGGKLNFIRTIVTSVGDVFRLLWWHACVVHFGWVLCFVNINTITP
jgi:hypothetical protein